MNNAPVDILGLVNTATENSVLHAMREDTNAAIELSGLLSFEDFYEPRYAVVFEAIRLLLLGIEPIDTKSILAQSLSVIKERKLKLYIDEHLVESLDQGDIQKYESYANSVKKLSWLRQAGDFAFWLTQELQSRPKPDSLYAAAQERWQMLAPVTTKSRFVYGWETEEQHDAVLRERIRRYEQGIISRFDFPWKSWNTIVRPLQAGFVGIIAAADGMGKTTYLEEIAEHWASRGIHVVYVHLEDNLDYKRDRRLARYSKVSIAHIQDGILDGEERQRIKEARERISGWTGYLHYLDAAGESMNSILAELETRVAEGVCEVIVYDYLDKTQPSRGQIQAYGGNIWERQANDMEQLKTFVQKHSIVALTATQGNKSMQGDGVQTRRAIQGSGQKSQKAQLVAVLTRDLLGPEGFVDGDGVRIAEEGEYSPIVKVRIDKQNIGRTGGFSQILIGEYFTVRDMYINRIPLNEPVTVDEPKPKSKVKYDGRGARGMKDDD